MGTTTTRTARKFHRVLFPCSHVSAAAGALWVSLFWGWCCDNRLISPVAALAAPARRLAATKTVAAEATETRTENVLLVGVTGGTGPRAVLGLLDSGRFAPSQLHALTRKPDSETARRLAARGVNLHAADLDDASSLAHAVKTIAPRFAYVHGTGGDTKALDTGETRRAAALADALAGHAEALELLAYNSAAADDGHGVERIAQKRECERLYAAKGLPLCALRANLFMEEFWKTYTRPAILEKRTFAFSVPPDKLLYLTSVRDMGRLAAATFAGDSPPTTHVGRVVDVASDARTPKALADAFGVKFKRARLLFWLSRLFFPELHQILRFYRTSSLVVDLDKLHRTDFPEVAWTDFDTFLRETHWSDPKRSYETLVNDL